MKKPIPNDLPRSSVHQGILRPGTGETPSSLVRLVELIEKDYQFQLGYRVIASMVQSATVEIAIEPLHQDDADRARRLAENLREVWQGALPKALRAIAFGRAAFERTYHYDAGRSLFLVGGLDYLPPEQTELALSDQGEFAGVHLRGENGQTLLEPARSWWFALDPTTTEPHGRSRYLGAPYEVWKARRQLDEQERIWYAKFAIGHGIARAPEHADLPVGPASAEEAVDPMESLRRELASIESGGILILSSRAYPDGRYLYDYRESEGQRDSKPLEQRRQMLDVAALRSLGIPERAITQDDRSGSRSVAQVHLEVLYRTCEGILDQLVTSFQRYVVRKAVEVNWNSGSTPTFRMTYRPLGVAAMPSPAEEHGPLARQILLAPELPPLIRTGEVDLDPLLASAGLTRGDRPIDAAQQ